MSEAHNGKVPSSKPKRNPDRKRLETQGNIMFWVTLAVMVAIVAVAAVYALVL
jgi:hypothetical protein